MKIIYAFLIVVVLVIAGVIVFEIGATRSYAGNMTPIQTANAFWVAASQDDDSTVRALSQLPDDQYASVQAAEKGWPEFRTLAKAAAKRYNDPSLDISSQMVPKAESEQDDGLSATVYDKGKTEICTLTASNNQGGPRWKVTHIKDSERIWNPRYTSAVELIANNFNAGQYKTEKEGLKAFYDAMHAADAQNKAAPPQPASVAASPIAPTATPLSAASPAASAWADQYFQSPALTDAQFVAAIPAVSLEVHGNPSVLEIIDKDHLYAAAQKALATNGVRIDPNSPFKLTAEASLLRDSFDLKRIDSDGETVQNTFRVFHFYVTVKISTRALCRRGDSFVPLNVSPIDRTTDFSAPLGSWDEGSYFLDTFGKFVSVVYKAELGDNDPLDPAREQTWQASRWSTAQDGDMQAAYEKAAQVDASTAPLQGVSDLDAFVAPDSDATLSLDHLTQAWQDSVQQAGFKVKAGAVDYVRDRVDVSKQSMNSASSLLFGYTEPNQWYNADFEQAKVWEDGVVIQIGEKYYHVNATLWDVRRDGISTPDKNHDYLQFIEQASMQDFGTRGVK